MRGVKQQKLNTGEAVHSSDTTSRGHDLVSRPDSLSDMALLTHMALGYPWALRSLHARHAPQLQRYLRRRFTDTSAIDEIVNDTFLTAWQKAQEFDVTRAQVRTWLVGIARMHARKLLSHLNQTSERKATLENLDRPLAEDYPDPAHILEAWQREQSLIGILQQLEPAHREILELLLSGDLSYGQISVQLNCPVNTVKTRLFNARKRMTEVLKRKQAVRTSSPVRTSTPC